MMMNLCKNAVDGVLESWRVFLASVNERESQPNFDRLWNECFEE